ncbi:hypothetical protein [Micromonospora viridifaciens]|uniref:hypothetical protein n=1 Tax=Micromonospora viridifaciens TaxID=1881 RepID=UPI0012FD073E|nr:hypothetical protein [Micromonospora viridifaciens]
MARWVARLLASLAVVVACSLGAATLPLGPATAAQAVAPTPAADTSTLRAGHLRGPESGANRQVVQPDLDHAERVGLPVGGPGRAVAVPVDRQRVLVGLPPAAVGPRAPPAR